MTDLTDAGQPVSPVKQTDQERQATELYMTLAPILMGFDAAVVAMALEAHIASTIDQGAPGMGDARKACMMFGDALWNTIIRIRTERDLKRR